MAIILIAAPLAFFLVVYSDILSFDKIIHCVFLGVSLCFFILNFGAFWLLNVIEYLSFSVLILLFLEIIFFLFVLFASPFPTISITFPLCSIRANCGRIIKVPFAFCYTRLLTKTAILQNDNRTPFSKTIYHQTIKEIENNKIYRKASPYSIISLSNSGRKPN